MVESDLERLKGEALSRLEGVAEREALEAWRVEYLGRRGRLTQVLRGIGQLPPDVRPQVGKAANLLKEELEQALAAQEARFRAEEMNRSLVRERLDVTLPGRPPEMGHLHLSTRTLRRMCSIFAEMGFQVEEGPEVETDEMNFQLLNIPPHHPARDMWSTFYIDETRLLRTHTSPGQIRVMRRYYPEPIRVILPGKCYRYEAVTARSEFMFHHVEGLAVGHHITMADLKGVLTAFTRKMFGEARQVRFRCSHFPFTEPSMEVDMHCILCGGAGCRVCKYSGWVEILGAGMVHPVVLQNGGYNPEVFSGFAFGIGVERSAMLLHRIDDIRLFFGNDLRFLEQF